MGMIGKSGHSKKTIASSLSEILGETWCTLFRYFNPVLFFLLA